MSDWHWPEDKPVEGLGERVKPSTKEAFKVLGTNSKDTACKCGRWFKKLGSGFKAGGKALAKEIKEEK